MSMFARENTVTAIESAVEEGTVQEKLYKRWGLDSYIMNKSMCSRKPLDEIQTDEDMYGEVSPRTIMGLIPDTLASILLNSSFRLNYDNSAFGNSYDPRKNLAVVKKTDDFLHEIGHGLWYNLISQDEQDKKQATIDSFSSEKRQALTEEQIPTMHKQYAALVGAFSGQFLLEHHPDNRRNDLEEHFARNFDYLLKGKPLHALPTSNATVSDFLEFYQSLGIIDDEFARFYKESIRICYRTRLINKTSIDGIVDGDRISTRLIKRVARIKENLKSEN